MVELLQGSNRSMKLRQNCSYSDKGHQMQWSVVSTRRHVSVTLRGAPSLSGRVTVISQGTPDCQQMSLSHYNKPLSANVTVTLQQTPVIKCHRQRHLAGSPQTATTRRACLTAVTLAGVQAVSRCVTRSCPTVTTSVRPSVTPPC